MNKLVNTFLLDGDKCMPLVHLRQREFFYKACEPFPKRCERLPKKNKETGVLSLVYKNELNEAYFVHDAVYSDSKDLVKKTISDEIFWKIDLMK